MIKYFTKENTEGYTDQELNSLNEELQHRLDAENIEEGTQVFWRVVKQFADEVAAR